MTTETKVLVDEFEAARVLGLSVHTLRKDRQGARRIPFYRIGTAVRYDPERIWQSLAEHELGGTVVRPNRRRA
jgi:hypothetical protein